MAIPVTRHRRPPLIVIEGPPGLIQRESAHLRAAGFVVVDGFDVVDGFEADGRRRPVVRVGVVPDAVTAALALLAAIDGAGLLLRATAEQVITDRLVDDLRRLGPVDHQVVASVEDEPELPADARMILGLLAEGHSLGEAAAILGLARRTADRRLSDARRVLGVTRTAEAISRAQRLGWLRPDRG